MASKGSNFFLDHLEKFILIIGGIVCIFFLFTKVILTPHSTELEGKTFSPGKIDAYIEAEARQLERHLAAEPEPGESYQKQIGKYLSTMDSPLQIDTTFWPPLPGMTGDEEWDGRQYSVPEPPTISGGAVTHIRAMAYIPTEKVGNKKTYDDAETEPNDLDLVTVEAQLDVARLYALFSESFAGSEVRPQWRDPCLAKPVFAAVQLQRAQRTANGDWGDWQVVPRLKIDHMRQMLEVIENVDALPRGGMKVRLLQYDTLSVMLNVLQSRAYDIASAEEDWFPPSLHDKFLSLLREQQVAQRREEMEKLKEERDKKLEDARKNRREGRPTRRTGGGSMGGSMGGSSGGGSMGGSMGGGSSGEAPTTRRRGTERPSRTRDGRSREKEELRRRREQEKETVGDVYVQLEELMITDGSDLDKMEEPLLFWAHDDTVEPGKTYRYRIRLGVFNSLAGTSKLKAGSESYKDQVIIWSNFVEAGSVEIPQKLYFFAKDIREAANTVIVEVFRYALGYWHSKEYAVEPGEVIGKIDEPEKPKEDEQQDSEYSVEDILIPEEVDFRTRAVMIDAVAVDDWAGGKNLRLRNYFNMYYSYYDDDIEAMPIQQRFWSKEMQSTYNGIRSSMKQPKKPPRERSGAVGGPRRGYRPAPGTEMPSGPMGPMGPMGPR